MGEIHPAGRERMLRGLLRGPLYLGLYRGLGEDEETDPAYQRQVIEFDGDADGLANGREIGFAPYALDGAAALRSWFVALTPSGDGAILWEELERPRQLLAREQLFFDAGELRVGW